MTHHIKLPWKWPGRQVPSGKLLESAPVSPGEVHFQPGPPLLRWSSLLTPRAPNFPNNITNPAGETSERTRKDDWCQNPCWTYVKMLLKQHKMRKSDDVKEKDDSGYFWWHESHTFRDLFVTNLEVNRSTNLPIAMDWFLWDPSRQVRCDGIHPLINIETLD